MMLRLETTGTAIVGTVSGTSISFGSITCCFDTDIYAESTSTAFDSINTENCCSYGKFILEAGYGKAIVGTVSRDV